MKKLTKKQLLATGVVIALGVGGGSALYANHANNIHKQKLMQVQAETKAHDEKLKKEKLAKEKQELQEQIKSIDNVMAIAIKNPTESSIKTATEAVSKLKDKIVLGVNYLVLSDELMKFVITGDNYHIICAYLAGKALGVDLVKVVEG